MQQIIVFIVLFCVAVGAQSTDSLIAAALEGHPAIAALQSEAAAAIKRGEAAAYWDNPVLGVEFSQIEAGSINLWNGALSNNLSLSQMIPLGGKMKKMGVAEASLSGVKKYELQETEVQLAGRLRMLLYRLAGKQEETAAQQHYLGRLQVLTEAVRNRYGGGRAATTDIYMALADSSAAAGELQKLLLEQASLTAEIVALSRGNITDAMLAGLSERLPEPALPGSGAPDLDSHPALLKMDAMGVMLRHEAAANDAATVPDLMAGAMIMRMPRGMILTTAANLHAAPEGAMTEYMYSLMASVTLPFAPWVSKKYSLKAEELSAAAAAAASQKEWMRLQMASGAGTAAGTIRQNLGLLENSRNGILPLLRSAEEAALHNYGSAVTGISPVLEAGRMYQMQIMKQIMYKTDARMGFAEYLMMTGKAFEQEITQ